MLACDLCSLFAELFDLKMKYDESDNVVIRATRAFTDKMGYLFGKLFPNTVYISCEMISDPARTSITVNNVGKFCVRSI